MAEIAGMLAAGALKLAAGKIAEAAGDRMLLQWRFGEDLEDMEDTVESIQAVLEDAEGQSITNASVRLWLKRLTRASTDISDMFDEFEVNKTRKSFLRKLKVPKPCLKFGPEVSMASKMKKVREKLEKISNHHHKFSFVAGSSSSNVQQVIDERATSPELIDANFLGRDEEKMKLMELLTRSSSSPEVVILPIYGLGGMGKTTLAQQLFNDTHFKDYKKVWVYVGKTFEFQKVQEYVGSQLPMDQGPLSSPEEPDTDPSASAGNKKILIVLDDLWEENENKLAELKDYLKKLGVPLKLHVIVIVTTRDGGIAEKIQTIEGHKILELSPDVCWNIIKPIAGYEDKKDPDKKLECIGRKIAEKCGGVALAARTIGYTLRSKNEDGWVSVKNSGIWNASNSGYTSSSYDNVLASLKLSYSRMPPYLRLCFAYCAIFPKGHNMAKDDLIYQWAALGFINQSEEVSIGQHGDICIMQLLNMSFFQHSKSLSSDAPHTKDVKYFTMHDLVHDLARSVVGDEFVDARQKSRRRYCRYAFLEDCSKPLTLFVTYPDKIRALHFLEGGSIEHCSRGFSFAKYLRVLDIGGCSCCLKKLASSIGQLKLLRYLNAQGIKDQKIPSCITKLSKLIYLSFRGSSKIVKLPESIGGMEGLMYLDLSDCQKIEKLPESFGKLAKLVHLDLSFCSEIVELPESIGGMKGLMYLDLSDCQKLKKLPESFGKLEKLVHLDLSGCQKIERLPESFGKLESLVHLDLSGCPKIEKLPESFGKLEGLVHLDLSLCSVVNGGLGALCSLTKLQHLNLSQKRMFKEVPTLEGLHEVIRNLIELRYLNLSRCMNLVATSPGEWFESMSTLSKMEHLDLSHNVNFKTIPDSVCSLRKLHTLDLTGCTDLMMLPVNMGDMESLKFLFVNGCQKLDRSTLPIKKSLILLPHFVVHAGNGEQRSNLILLKDANNPPELEIMQLENVKSVEEARKIELKEKQSMLRLTLDWTRGSNGFVGDTDLLTELLPPRSLETFVLRGYNSVNFPAWLMDIAVYVPKLTSVILKGLSRCSSLPRLGQLPNLKYLTLEDMPGITKIDRGFCGDGMKPFGQLEVLHIVQMENLEEWITTYSCDEGGADEFMFPNLEFLYTGMCPKLRVGPCPPRVKGTWWIEASDEVLLQWDEGAPNTVCCSTSSTQVHTLSVTSCQAPMHLWKLLHHLPALHRLVIIECNSLSSSSEITRALVGLWSLDLRGLRIQTLPEWLGDLTSLKELTIISCDGIKSFPDSIQQLTSLEHLGIGWCPDLRRWCEIENKTKIGHIKKIKFID